MKRAIATFVLSLAMLVAVNYLPAQKEAVSTSAASEQIIPHVADPGY
jgi:hypothetical protein